MAENRSDPGSADEFPPSSAREPERFGREGEVNFSSAEDASTSFYLDMAKLWVQEHKKASMLGAFAVGVFVGALLRD